MFILQWTRQKISGVKLVGEKILNMGCVFRCSCCPTVKLKPNEIMLHGVNVEGYRVLTTSTQMSVITTGSCPFSEIPPNQTGITCIPRPIAGHWEKTSKHTVGGKNLLIESSEFVCEASKLKGGDGRITAEINPVIKSSQDGYSPQILVSVGLISEETKHSTSRKSCSLREKVDNPSNKNNGDGVRSEKKEDITEKDRIIIRSEDLYCPYDSSKEKCKNCKYVQTDDSHMLSAKKEDSSKQPGVILRDNYEIEFNSLSATRKGYRIVCNSLKEEYDIFCRIGCGNQAHHILSTKDVYEQDKLRFVLKLANFYGYDVNEAYNCIILPSYNSKAERAKTEFQVSFSKASNFDKRSSKYYAMRMSGRQWHGGGHGDDFENSQNISCYATEVTELVYQCMRKESKNHCRIQEGCYEVDKKVFIGRLHKALNYVREHLIAFDVNPQKSLPFYVSRDAYEYAFEVANIRVLVFRKSDTGIQSYKYMFTRRSGNTYPDERGVKEFDISNELSKKKLVVFCEQIDIAYIDSSKGIVNLPFSIMHTINVDMRGIDVLTYFKSNISAVEAEIVDYEGPDGSVMKRRLMELKG